MSAVKNWVSELFTYAGKSNTKGTRGYFIGAIILFALTIIALIAVPLLNLVFGLQGLASVVSWGLLVLLFICSIAMIVLLNKTD